MLNNYKTEEDSQLDAGIRDWVKFFLENGIETFESCEGGIGHAFPVPTIRFFGGRPEGLKALAIAQQNNLPVDSLRRTWPIIDGEMTGPYWEITFWKKKE